MIKKLLNKLIIFYIINIFNIFKKIELIYIYLEIFLKIANEGH
jgi:hypothetical protein